MASKVGCHRPAVASAVSTWVPKPVQLGRHVVSDFVPQIGHNFPSMVEEASARPNKGNRRRVSRACPRDAEVSSAAGSKAKSNADIDEFSRIQLAQKQMDIAVADENYERAAQLRDTIRQLQEKMPPLLRLMSDNVRRLSSENEADRVEAIRILGEVGDLRVLPQLAGQLHRGPACQQAADEAMWSVLMRVKDPECQAIFMHGVLLMSDRKSLVEAAEAFSRVIDLDPTLPEAWNKRATVFYLMGRYEEARADCLKVLEACPHHFGALSGMCLIHRALNDPKEALVWCRKALSVHPGLEAIRVLAESCERQLED